MKKTFTEQEVMIMLVQAHVKGEECGTQNAQWGLSKIQESEICAKDCSEIINEFKNQ